ncbi:MAG: hypothetical protein Q9219_005237 [cf. Caloplaca sp. 3 TL-2023]
MRTTSFYGLIKSTHRLTGLSNVPGSTAKRSSAQWVCCRCQSRLIRTISTTDRSSSPRAITKSTKAPTSHRHASTDSKPGSSEDTSSPLPSHTESLRSPLSRRLTHLLDTFQASAVSATQQLNTLTGYTGIESLKSSISAQETHLERTRSALAAARTAYTSAINSRSASQREVNALLQRKHAWSPQDLERFTELYRNDHANELQESQAHDTLVTVEKEAEDAGARLSESILKRYHEEQIWSDKIRRMSTWGTWGLMGVNVLLFLVFQIGVEPWRRKRLVKGFEEKVREALEEERKIDLAVNVSADKAVESNVYEKIGIPEKLDEHVLESMVDTARRDEGGEGRVEIASAIPVDVEVATNEMEMLVDQEIEEEILSEKGRMAVLKAGFEDLFSDREILVRRWDLTALVLEGVAAGMTVAGAIALLLRSR